MIMIKRHIYNALTNTVDSCLKPFRKLIHKFIQAYLRHCGGDFHTNPYGPDGRYVVLMDEGRYHRYMALAYDAKDADTDKFLFLRDRWINADSDIGRHAWWRTQGLAADYFLTERQFGQNITEQTYYLHQLGEVMRDYSMRMKGRN